ncbi:acyl-CoA thioesterase-1 [Azonexus fungiphilus]|uniref:Acyl-CoA thioesterase-1 n=1 Tax=Azonexus fungiphilus TaxID=146940 RepID=A0A495VJV8_9RHOO|nr:arylesterase [Azonexus fungiphilus]RKT49574.1 acyl-CoA thioesterase-1 [Azonexus fungiphilus]
MRTILFLLSLLVVAPSAFAARTILVMGDSLSAGYGIRPQQAWPSLMQERLRELRLDYSVANLSISGETSAGGRSRFAAALKEHQPAVVVLALGANDGLRGLPLQQMENNLAAMIAAARKAGARVLVAGMRLPPNYGPYAEQFFQRFGEVAKAEKTAYLPFLLEPVATRPELFQADRLHPTAEAQPLLLDHLWPALRPLLR